MQDGWEPVGPDEIIYRRIATVYMAPEDAFPSPRAFTPTPIDTEGLSVYRAKYTTSIEDITHNDRGAQFYVAVFKAGDLFAAGIQITPSPDVKNNKPGHAHLPAITYQNRKEPPVVNLINLLATQLCTVHGPFPTNQKQFP